MYAIIATGGKQYRVSEGDVIYIEKIDAEVDSTVSFDVLLMENEGDVKVGTPVVEGVKVEGKVVGQVRGDKIYIEKIDAEVGSTVSFDVLLVEDNGDVKVGTPVVEGVKVEGKVEAQTRGEKIIVFKYKAKKNYRRKQGHRQPYTKVEITKIG